MTDTTLDSEALKAAVCSRVDELADQLIDASHQIHAHPELNFQEHFAHDLLTDLLERHGVAPTRHAYGLETAFDSSAGQTGEPPEKPGTGPRADCEKGTWSYVSFFSGPGHRHLPERVQVRLGVNEGRVDVAVAQHISDGFDG